MSRQPSEEIVSFLSDLYSVELQAVAQLSPAIDLAGAPELESAYRTHYLETEQQAAMVRARLEKLGGSPSVVQDFVMKLGGKAFVLFAKVLSETPGRLHTHSYAYEAMEWAGYEVLIRMAEAVGDAETAALGRSVQAQERGMMQRLEAGFDAAEAVSHADTSAEDLPNHVKTHLAEIHAIEKQSLSLLERSSAAAESPELARIHAEHADETRRQIEALEARLHALGHSPSLLEDAAMEFGALNWTLFFKAQADTPAKLHAFGYAMEHLEIGGYELLLRTARRAGDHETASLCERIIGEEKAMAGRIAGSMDRAVQETLIQLQRS